MSGNVYEWCHDWNSDSYYRVSRFQNPTGPTTGTRR
ncbi:MAG: formylglycine-generating enzyme family protein, partial [Fibrobacter sp.]|nr:formylglycine-generating enzyme family protein [Fibrobacter sp.]